MSIDRAVEGDVAPHLRPAPKDRISQQKSIFPQPVKVGDGVEVLLEFTQTQTDAVTLMNCISLEGNKLDLPLGAVVALVERELGGRVAVGHAMNL